MNNKSVCKLEKLVLWVTRSVYQLLPEELATEVDEHELRMQREAEELAAEGGYYDPSIEEDISQTYRDKHNWQGMPEKFNEK